MAKVNGSLTWDEEYDRAVATVNLMYRFSRPACVLQPLKASQVQKVIKLASSHDIPITIKNGGHSFSGSSTADSGILLDLRKMNKVSLNMKTKTMTMEGGALWGNSYKQLINGRHDGWVVNGGRCVTVGVSGLVLGGGITPFGRELGLCCDSLKVRGTLSVGCHKLDALNADHSGERSKRYSVFKVCILVELLLYSLESMEL